MAIAVLTFLVLTTASMMKLEPVLSELTCQVHDMKALMVNIRKLRTEFQEFKDETQAKFDAKQMELDSKQRKIDSLQTELKDFKNATQTELDTKQGDLDAMRAELDSVQTELKDFKNATQRNLDAKQRDLEVKQMEIDAMRVDFGVLQTEFKDYKSVTDTRVDHLETKFTSSVAFVARNPPTPLPTDIPVIFATTVLNSGNAYSSRTGRFTAPVSGTYMFSVQFCALNYVEFQIVVNNDVAGVSHYHSTIGLCSSMSTVAVMQSGQQAWVMDVNGGDRVAADDINKSWNMFTGALIAQN